MMRAPLLPYEDRWLSVQEVATHLGVSRETVYQWIKVKRMPAHRIGRHWKFKRREVDDWVRHDGAEDDAHVFKAVKGL